MRFHKNWTHEYPDFLVVFTKRNEKIILVAQVNPNGRNIYDECSPEYEALLNSGQEVFLNTFFKWFKCENIRNVNTGSIH